MADGYVVWLNGAFGVGKTTVGRALAAGLPDARIVDCGERNPEADDGSEQGEPAGHRYRASDSLTTTAAGAPRCRGR